MSQKLVIVIPTKNRHALLKRALASVSAQSYQDYRVVVVNDGSTDDTREYLDALNDPRLQVVHHDKSRGVNASRNEAYKSLKEGEWAVPLDDDDYFLPGAFETIAAALGGVPEHISVVQFNTIVQTRDDEFQGGWQYRRDETIHDFTYLEAMGASPIRIQGEARPAFKWTLFPRYLFAEDVNGFEGEWWMLAARNGVGIRYVKTGPIAFIDWRHEGEHLSDTAARRDPASFVRAYERIFPLHKRFYNQHRSQGQAAAVSAFKLAIRALDPIDAVRFAYKYLAWFFPHHDVSPGDLPQLVIPMFGPIGDMLMTLAFVDDILKLNPKATFCLLTRRGTAMMRELSQEYPQVEIRQIPSGLKSLSFYGRLLIERHVLVPLGVAIDYSFALKMFFLAMKLRGDLAVGLGDASTNSGRGWLPFDVVLPLQKDTPIIEQYRSILPYLGYLPEEIARIAGRPPHVLLRGVMPGGYPEKGRYIVVHPFGSSLYRTFPMRRWIALLTLISNEFPQHTFVITGSGKDREQAEEIARGVPHARTAIDLPMAEVIGLVDGAALYIGVDTGITHVAGVLEQKSLIINHCNSKRWNATYNPNARVIANSVRCVCHIPGAACTAKEGTHECYRCLYDITDEAVLSAVRRALSSSARSISGFAGWFDENN